MSDSEEEKHNSYFEHASSEEDEETPETNYAQTSPLVNPYSDSQEQNVSLRKKRPNRFYGYLDYCVSTKDSMSLYSDISEKIERHASCCPIRTYNDRLKQPHRQENTDIYGDNQWELQDIVGTNTEKINSTVKKRTAARKQHNQQLNDQQDNRRRRSPSSPPTVHGRADRLLEDNIVDIGGIQQIFIPLKLCMDWVKNSKRIIRGRYPTANLAASNAQQSDYDSEESSEETAVVQQQASNQLGQLVGFGQSVTEAQVPFNFNKSQNGHIIQHGNRPSQVQRPSTGITVNLNFGRGGLQEEQKEQEQNIYQLLPLEFLRDFIMINMQNFTFQRLVFVVGMWPLLTSYNEPAVYGILMMWILGFACLACIQRRSSEISFFILFCCFLAICNINEVELTRNLWDTVNPSAVVTRRWNSNHEWARRYLQYTETSQYDRVASICIGSYATCLTLFGQNMLPDFIKTPQNQQENSQLAIGITNTHNRQVNTAINDYYGRIIGLITDIQQTSVTDEYLDAQRASVTSSTNYILDLLNQIDSTVDESGSFDNETIFYDHVLPDMLIEIEDISVNEQNADNRTNVVQMFLLVKLELFQTADAHKHQKK